MLYRFRLTINEINRLFPVTHSPSVPFILITGLTGATLLLASCKRISDRMEITETREISSHSPAPKAMASSAERFFDQQEPETKTSENPLTWATPEGWTEAPPQTEAAAGMTVGTHGSTYGGNPLAMAVANAAMAELARPELLQHVNDVAGYFV